MSRRSKRRARTTNVAPVSDNGRLNLPGVRPEFWETMYGPTKTASITTNSILGIPTYFRCLRILSCLPALLPARVLVGRGKKMRVEEEHPIANMFNWSFDRGETNAYQDRCFVGDQKHRLGNAVGEIIRDGRGSVTRIRWLQRHEVSIYKDENKNKRYEFELGPNTWSDPVPPRKVFHLPNYAPDGFLGRSNVQMHAELLQTAALAADSRSEFYRQGGRPSGYIRKKDRIADPKFKDEMREEWRQASPNGLAILHGDTEYVALSLPPEDAKFLEGMKWDATQICQIMGVPPYMAGIGEKAADLVAEELAIHFVLNTLMPEVRAIEAEASLKLFGTRTEGDPNFRLELDLSTVLLASLKSQAEYYGKMVGCGGMVPDEVRSDIGRAPHPDGIGSIPLVAGNNYVRLSDVVDGTVQNGATLPGQQSDGSKEPTKKPTPKNSSDHSSEAVGLLHSITSSISPENRAVLATYLEQVRGKTPDEVERTLAT